MKRTLSTVILFLFIMSPAFSEPDWFSGPMLADDATVVPLGHWNLKFYNYAINSQAIYNNHGHVTHTAYNFSEQLIPEFAYGLAEHVDVQWDPIFIYNATENKQSSGLGDTELSLGYQVFTQTASNHHPDLRMTLGEIFPSGRYDALVQANHGTDAFGMGSYQTVIGFNFQYAFPLQETHTLNSHFSLSMVFPSRVELQGLSTYGGNRWTKGTLQPGSLYEIDGSIEYNFTPQWIGILELYGEYQTADHFYGDRGIRLNDQQLGRLKKLANRLLPTKHNIRTLSINDLAIGNDTMNLFSLSPGIEYNFSEHYALIAGGWFSVLGKNTLDFSAIVVVLNINF